MKTSKKMVVALLGVSVGLMGGAGVFAATSGALTTTATPPAKIKVAGTGQIDRSVKFDSFLSGLSLTQAKKDQLKTLMETYRSEKQEHRNALKSATSTEAKEKLKTAWQTREAELKKQILSLVPASSQSQVESFFSKGRKRGKGGDKSFEQRGGKMGFLWSFIDQTALSEAQKQEIQSLQTQKHQKMQTLLAQLPNVTETRKAEIQSELRQINQDFLKSLKKYVAADKITAYETFVSESKNRSSKAESRGGKKLKNQTSSLVSARSAAQ